MKRYREIIYLQDDSAVDGLAILARDGKQAALDYLLQWDKTPGRVMKQLILPGHQYRVGKYIVFYDQYSPHIGLTEILDFYGPPAAGKQQLPKPRRR